MRVTLVFCLLIGLFAVLMAGYGPANDGPREMSSARVCSAAIAVSAALDIVYPDDASDSGGDRWVSMIPSGLDWVFHRLVEASRDDKPDSTPGDTERSSTRRGTGDDKVWRSDTLNLLGIGLAIGDVTGDGKKDIVVIDPGTVYVYEFSDKKLRLIADFSRKSLELKSVDVVASGKLGPSRIYVTAQNRAVAASFVLEYRNGSLAPVVENLPYYLRAIQYPTKGSILLGQRKGLSAIYDGPIFQVEDKGGELAAGARFGIPLKIPIFGFAIGDLEGKLSPMIVAYDRNDHLRIYTPEGKRLYRSLNYYGGSDIVLRHSGPEDRREGSVADMEDQSDREYFRPRIMALDLDRDRRYEVIAITHTSTTRRMLSRTKMLEEGQVVGLVWNGDSLEEKWITPKVQGMVTDFTIDTMPGLSGTRLITLEREKTDWFSFLSSRSRIRAYDLDYLMKERRSDRTVEGAR